MTSRAVRTAARVASEIPGLPLRTRLTVASLTPACFATSASLRATVQLYDKSVQILRPADAQIEGDLVERAAVDVKVAELVALEQDCGGASRCGFLEQPDEKHPDFVVCQENGTGAEAWPVDHCPRLACRSRLRRRLLDAFTCELRPDATIVGAAKGGFLGRGALPVGVG